MTVARGLAVVSGAGSGIGREIALALARRGHPLALLGRNTAALEETLAAAGLVADSGITLGCDVRDPVAVGKAAAEIHRRWPAAEIVVPASGLTRISPLEETSPSDFAAVVETNLHGTFFLLRELLPAMKREGRGWIFPILSVAAKRAFPGWSAYCASKWGLAGLVAALREELNGTGVRVTALCPGATDTSIWNDLPGEWNRSAMVPAQEIARAVLFSLDAAPSSLYEEIHIGPAGGAL